MELITVSTLITPATAAFQGQKPYDLVPLRAVKRELRITDSGDDDLYRDWITQASAAAAKYCNRVFPIETVQNRIYPPRDYFPAPTVIGGVKPLQLSRWPLAVEVSTAGTPPPAAPVLSAVAGGSLPGTFYARVSYVTATGETAASLESTLIVATGLLQVASPLLDKAGLAIGWNCYLGNASGAEILQNVAPLPIGTAFTLPVSGVVTEGAPLPPYVLAVENNRALAEGNDFLVKPGDGELVRLDSNGWPKHWPALATQIIFAAGYAFDDPDFADAQDAVIRMVKARYFARTRDPMLRSQNIPGAWEAQYWFASGPGAPVGNMTPDVAALLGKYRVPVLA
jgi:hypothetical protein